MKQTKLIKELKILNSKIMYMSEQLVNVGLPIGGNILDYSIDISNKLTELDDVIHKQVCDDFDNAQKQSKATLDLALMCNKEKL